MAVQVGCGPTWSIDGPPPTAPLHTFVGAARVFEDVTDETDNETRRVHWTIIKRMVADQNSGKAISAVYVLRRDDVDTEFPSLGTARAVAESMPCRPMRSAQSATIASASCIILSRLK